MLNNLLGPSILCFLLFSCAPEAKDRQQENTSTTSISPEEEAAVKELIMGAFDDLWGGMDSTKILNYHTPDFYILEHGEVWDNDRITSWMKGRLQEENRPLRINSMEYIDWHKYGGSITCSYHNYAKFMQGDSLLGEGQWLESALAVETEEGWRLRMMHSTRVPRQQ